MISGGPNGNVRMSLGENGNMRMEMSKISIPRLADLLTPFMDRPVLDMTELKGNYQVALKLPMQELMNIARAMAPELAGAARLGLDPAVAHDQELRRPSPPILPEPRCLSLCSSLV